MGKKLLLLVVLVVALCIYGGILIGENLAYKLMEGGYELRND